MSSDKTQPSASAGDPSAIEYIDLQKFLRPPLSPLTRLLRTAGGVCTIVLLLMLVIAAPLMLYEMYVGEIHLSGYEQYESLMIVFALLFFISCIGTILHLGFSGAWSTHWHMLQRSIRNPTRVEFNEEKFPGLSTPVQIYAASGGEIVRRFIEYCSRSVAPSRNQLKPNTASSLTLTVLGYLLIIAGVPAIVNIGFAKYIFGLLIPNFSSYTEGFQFVLILASGLIFGLGVTALYYSRRIRQFSAVELLNNDSRPAVLYLRSFQAEKLQMATTSSGSMSWARWEELLTDRFTRIGPFIAVGEPGESLPEIGAARAYFENSDWQTAATNFMRDARLIVILLGHTQWLKWELKTAISNGHIDKTIVLLPPASLSVSSFFSSFFLFGGHYTSRSRDDADSLKSSLVECFDGTMWEDGVRNIDLTSAIGMHFMRDGKVVVLRSDSHEKNDYELAIVFACYGALVHQSRPGE